MDIDERAFARIKKAKESNTDEITIRDYFAAKILPAVYSDYCKDADIQGYVEGWRIGVAKDAYAMADAMLVERNKQNV